MKKFELKAIIIYILLICYLLFTNLFLYQNHSQLVSLILNPIFFCALAVFCILIEKDHKTRIKFQTAKLQTIFIIVTIYFIFYFLLGLFLGYSKSIYSHTPLGIIKNLWMYLLPIFEIEYIRKTLVDSNHSILNHIFVAILFTLVLSNLYSILNFSNYSMLFKNIFSVFIPSFANSLLLVFLSRTCGYYGNLFYRVPQTFLTISLPILPSINWYYTSILGILLPLITFLLIQNIHNKAELSEPRRFLRKKSGLKFLPILIPLLFLICFASGVFKYKPIAVLSNSMHPIFDRGDLVIVQKLNQNELEKLKKYDIIEYILGDSIITHRIIHIEKHSNGKWLYTTMGDHNNAPDIKKVGKSQITGKILFRIPKIGYPSVWLSDFLKQSKKVPVEVGDRR